MKNLDHEFAKIIRGKRVSVVGPAAYMQGSGFGKVIDDSDVVIRINRSHESTSEYGADIGYRTDVLYSCLIEKPENAGKVDLKDLQEKGIKCICAPPASDMKGYASSTKFSQLVDMNKINRISEQILVRLVDHKFHTEIASKINCRPNTGFLLIFDVLRFQPEVLNIYGFSFYLDGFVTGTKLGIESSGLTEDTFAKKCFNSKRHKQENMWNYAKKELPQMENVFLDPVLGKILSMNTFSQDEFRRLYA